MNVAAGAGAEEARRSGGLKSRYRFGAGIETQARALLSALTEEHAEELVATFYQAFLADSQAASFLSSELVHARLGRSLRDWLKELVAFDIAGDPAAFDAHQRRIGEVHARIKIPIHLVLDGVNLLKGQITELIARGQHDPEIALAAVVILNHLADYAMASMSEAYVLGIKRSVRVDEAFRLFALGQDVSIERESQRAALMEWSQSIFLAVLAGPAGEVVLDPIAQSNFGLCMRHRAGMMFAGMSSLAKIEALMQRIDGELLLRLASLPTGEWGAMTACIGELNEAIEQIRYHFIALFQSASHVSSGRDALTQMLNRRFMPAILSQEVTFASEGGVPLSLLMIDIDHFKAINDGRGHPAGDAVIREVADIVLQNVRASDFAFRYGGEEFLLALVETPLATAMTIAERIRIEVAGKAIALPDGSTLTATISIGVASFRGHPDHEFLLQRADRALYLAKESGRNQVQSCNDGEASGEAAFST